MARKFLYIIGFLTILVIAGAFIFRIFSADLMRVAFVPGDAFVPQQPLSTHVYDDTNMWFANPDRKTNNPSLWLPKDAKRSQNNVAAIFFVHPTSFFSRQQWNAPLDDKESQRLARIFLRGQSSAFSHLGAVWAPRYRQATLGAFLTDKKEGQQALDAAYGDIALAFDYFLAAVPEDKPIIMAGHSQGSLHLTRLLKDKVAGKPVKDRVIAAYAVGWPVSFTTDIPAIGLPACDSADAAGCILAWQSFANPAEYKELKATYDRSTGLNGKARRGSKMLCNNPLDGSLGGDAPASLNLGTLVPNEKLSDARLVAQSVPAKCNDDGILLIGSPPDLGPYALPGNNYHVYDYNLFWANIRVDALRRTKQFLKR